MAERALFRIGAVAAMVGAVLAIIFNVLHPRTTKVGDPEADLHLIAESGAWSSTHVALLIAVLLVAGGLAALYRSIDTEPGAAWARLGFLAAAIGTAIFGVLSGIDGYVRERLVAEWVGAAAEEKAIAFRLADAVEQINFGMFSVFVVVFFGAAFLLYGLAVAFSKAYPRWLGWVAVVGGLGGLVVGLIQLHGVRTLWVTNILFPVVSILLTVWVFVMGILLWRRGSA